jgi:two-component system cell cycle sensor histidine kinase/response regulator CckA
VQPSISPRGRGTILIVEDEAELRQGLAESLSALGYRVLEAEHGGKALEIVEKHSGQIDLLLSDAVMPHMRGVDLLHRIRTTYPGIKLILMSGNPQITLPNSASGEDGEEDGNIVFLQKPFAHAELAQAVRKLLIHSLAV